MHVVAMPATGEVFMNSPATHCRRGRNAQRFGTLRASGAKSPCAGRAYFAAEAATYNDS